MKYITINGWTKAQMIEAIQERMLDHRSVRDSNDSWSACSYQSDDGNRCAIGVFIPDGHAAESFNGGIASLLTTYPDLVSLIPLEEATLRHLQSLHDDHTPITSDPRPNLINWIEENVEDGT